MKFTAHRYQLGAAEYLLYHPYASLLADPGTGKTAILLMLLHELKRQGPLPPVLVTSTLRIATTVWPGEIAKWDQFNGITYQVLHGKDRIERAKTPADIHIINNEGLRWLEKAKLLNSYRILIIDESSKYKSWMSGRTKILRRHIKQFERRYALTGSPAPKSLVDLFAQQYLVDAGATFGSTIGPYRGRYFLNIGERERPKWEIRHGCEDTLYQKIAPHCYRLDGQQLLDMPPMLVNDVPVILPKEASLKSRKTMKALADATLLDGPLFAADNAATDYMLSRQLAGGFMTDGERIHDAKVRVLDEIIDELQGKNVMVFFCFRAEGFALSSRYNSPVIMGGTKPEDAAEYIRAWNKGDLPMLLLHPASTGHGLNLQDGGNDIVWYSLTDNQDDYYQGNRRVWRQGVRGTVRIHRLIAKGSIDVAISRSLEAKTNQQQALLDAVKELTNCLES